MTTRGPLYTGISLHFPLQKGSDDLSKLCFNENYQSSFYLFAQKVQENSVLDNPFECNRNETVRFEHMFATII